ncbi:hypothetical protein PS15p_210954 [Mucor circinelloides]
MEGKENDKDESEEESRVVKILYLRFKNDRTNVRTNSEITLTSTYLMSILQKIFLDNTVDGLVHLAF